MSKADRLAVFVSDVSGLKSARAVEAADDFTVSCSVPLMAGREMEFGSELPQDPIGPRPRLASAVGRRQVVPLFLRANTSPGQLR